MKTTNNVIIAKQMETVQILILVQRDATPGTLTLYAHTRKRRKVKWPAEDLALNVFVHNLREGDDYKRVHASCISKKYEIQKR